jgi:PKD repeat protein
VLIPTETGTTGASRTVKLADAASGYNADGTITLVVNAADIGLDATAAGTPAQTLSQFLSRVSNSSGTTPDNMPDAATQGAGSYATRPLAFCAPNVLPVAALTVDNATKAKNEAFNFSGAGSSDADAGDTIVRYAFDFGDQTAEVVSTAPTASHAYSVAGVYSVKLTVTDSKGGVSAQPATLGVTVTEPATPPTTTPAPVIAGSPGALPAVKEGRYGGALPLSLLVLLLSGGLRRRAR